MKIAYVFSYFGDGGAEAHALLLAEHARASGDEPYFIISKSSVAAQQRLQKAGFYFAYLPMESSFNPIKVLLSALGLKKIIRDHGGDIVHVHMLREQGVAIISKMIGVKFILIRTFHRFDQFNPKMKPLLPIYQKYTDAFISISDLMTEYLAKNGITKKVSLIYNGVDKILTRTHEQAIGFIGRLSPEKGVLKFIEANQVMLHDKKMVIAGTGPEYETIDKLIKERRLNVELMGDVTEKVEFYKKISVLVLPSETEVMPMVVLEAYSCGLPVVAFDLLALKYLIGSTNGKLVQFPDYIKLGEAAAEFMISQSYYEQTNIELFNQKYSSEIMWKNTAVLYRSLYNQTPNMIKSS